MSPIVHLVPHWGPAHIVDHERGENCFCDAWLVVSPNRRFVVHRDPLDIYFLALGNPIDPRHVYMNIAAHTN